MPFTKLSLAWNNLIIPARESLVSDIPAGDEKAANLFFTVYRRLYPVLGVLDEPYSAKLAQRSSHTGPLGYIGLTLF